MPTSLRWGILATGHIAHAFARGLRGSSTGRLTAVGSRNRETSVRFGGEYGLGIDSCHATYEALLADERVEAVYIATPHPSHAEWAVKCAEAGKHILCEKPLALNATDAAQIIEAARRHDVFLMEAFMYRCHPRTSRLVELVRAGALGRVRVIQATFSFQAEYDPRGRLFDPALGGGGILDVGCYPVSMCRLIAGAATGLPFAEPVALKAVAQIGETGVDVATVAVLKFPGDILAQAACGTLLAQDNAVRIYGETGSLHVPVPWAPARDGGTSRISLHRTGQEQPEEIALQTPRCADHLYALEADHVAAHLEERQAPAMPWLDTLGNMRTLDQWRIQSFPN